MPNEKPSSLKQPVTITVSPAGSSDSVSSKPPVSPKSPLRVINRPSPLDLPQGKPKPAAKPKKAIPKPNQSKSKSNLKSSKNKKPISKQSVARTLLNLFSCCCFAGCIDHGKDNRVEPEPSATPNLSS